LLTEGALCIYEAIGGTFEAAIKGAKETVGSVKSFIEDIDAVV
jgi:hypothetical protein